MMEMTVHCDDFETKLLSRDDGDDELEADDAVTISVGGVSHVTRRTTLLAKPDTRLGRMIAQSTRTCFSFDRNPQVFSSIMDYYRSSELHTPLNVCGSIVKRELEYWGINEAEIELCCLSKYVSYMQDKDHLQQYRDSTAVDDVTSSQHLIGWRKGQTDVWTILDHPRSSCLAMIYAITSFLVILLSILVFALETIPAMKGIHSSHADNESCFSFIQSQSNMRLMSPNSTLQTVDWMCTIFFTIELLVRLIFAPSKYQFFTSVLNIIDILALLPLYVQIVLTLIDPQHCIRSQFIVIETLFILRIIRVLRIFHMVKHYQALRVLILAIKTSVNELLMLAIFFFVAMVMFSTLVFYAERKKLEDSTDAISTIPLGLWWAIITLTTVGYGDMVPKSTMGSIIAGICAVSGILLISLVVPILSNNFALFYYHSQVQEHFMKGRKRQR